MTDGAEHIPQGRIAQRDHSGGDDNAESCPKDGIFDGCSCPIIPQEGFQTAYELRLQLGHTSRVLIVVQRPAAIKQAKVVFSLMQKDWVTTMSRGARISRRALLAGAGATLLASPLAGQEVAPQTLRLVRRNLDIAGKSVDAFGIEGAANAGFLRGGPFLTRVENQLKVPALLHWHGLHAPVGSDGSSPPEGLIEPGASVIYDFPVTRSGTHMMRASSGLLQQQLLAAPLIVRDIDELALGEQEVVMFLQDYTWRDPDDILTEFKTGELPSKSVFGKIGLGGKVKPAVSRATGLVAFDAYLANDRTLDDPEIVAVDPAMPVRLRLINACAASNMLLDFSGMDAVLLALDGRAISALNVRSLALACGQRADVRVTLPGPGAYPVLALAEGTPARAGIVLATPGAGVEKLAVKAEMAPMVTEFALESRPFGADAPADRPVDVKATFDLGGKAGEGWNINGNSDAGGVLIKVKLGQRVEVLLRNQTVNSQSLHLHGHSFQVRGTQGQKFAGPMRDTLLVPPQSRVLISFDADNPGIWPFASTHIYRRLAGLVGMIAYEGI